MKKGCTTCNLKKLELELLALELKQKEYELNIREQRVQILEEMSVLLYKETKHQYDKWLVSVSVTDIMKSDDSLFSESSSDDDDDDEEKEKECIIIGGLPLSSLESTDEET